MNADQEKIAVLRIEQIIQSRDPVYLKAREILKQIIVPLVEEETETYRKLAYAKPAD